jgi:glycosyltransferase involved in cell wall biosynthesis
VSDSSSNAEADWVVCQIGAREHYAVARALHASKKLAALVTDVWVNPGSPLRVVSSALSERFHPALADATVHASSWSAVAREIVARATRQNGWERILARNNWFQREAVKHLARLPDKRITVFAYSYAAREIFSYARARGWSTILGQIDPGPYEERIVAELHRTTRLESDWAPAPTSYWNDWREECELADAIAVNSAWSSDALREEGIPQKKLRLLPLAFEPPSEATEYLRTYPAAFSDARPMRVLFLGQVNLRKGIGPLLSAIKLLAGAPIEFWIVGPVQIEVPVEMKTSPRVRWFGKVDRDAIHGFYRRADVFVLPTFSDGFGLTQLEARAWHLPVLASRFCGDVVSNGVDGWKLKDLSGEEIATCLRAWLENPNQLKALAAGMPGKSNSLKELARTLRACVRQ